MTREPVSEHYDSGPLGPRVTAALTAAGLDSPGVSFEAFAPIDEFHVGGLEATLNLIMNMMAGRVGVAEIVATRAER